MLNIDIIKINNDELYKLKDPKTGKFYTDIVNIKESVYLDCQDLTEIPVQFGSVNYYFSCENNKLTSLVNAPRETNGHFYCQNNKIASLEGIHKIIHKIDGFIDISSNPIKRGGIGLLLVQKLNEVVSDLRALKIINKYLGQGKKGLLLCQEELIEEGYEEYAKL